MMEFRTPETDHETIWLEPECCGEGNEFGRTWCQDDAWECCEDGIQPTKYVRADLFDAANARIAELESAVANARRAALEEAALAACRRCAAGQSIDHNGWHLDGAFMYECKGKAIRALIDQTPPDVVTVPRAELSALVERLNEWSNEHLTDDSASDWHGHIEPVYERLKALIEAAK